MLLKEQIVSYFDNIYLAGTYWTFPILGDPYSFLIDCRLNVFKHLDKWAVVVERLGYSQKGGCIELQIIYMGNCLQDLEFCNGQTTNNYFVYPVEQKSFENSINGFSLNKNQDFWIIKDNLINLSFDKHSYLAAGITLKEYEPDEISAEEAARFIIIKDKDAFRATDEQLYKSIPLNLQKILVLDEWHHKDYMLTDNHDFSDDEINKLFQYNKSINGLADLDINSFRNLMTDQFVRNGAQNQINYNDCRPGSYETWLQISEVIINGDVSLYHPSLSPNTHWRNWPESGSL